MPSLDEVVAELGLTDEQKARLTEAVNEAGPKPVREALDRAKAEIAELKPKAERFDAQQRWPEVEKAFEGYTLDGIADGLKAQMESFSDIDNPAKVAEFAKTWGLQQKAPGQQQTPPPNTAGDLVDVATDTQQVPAGDAATQEALAKARAAKTPEEQKAILQSAGLKFV